MASIFISRQPKFTAIIQSTLISFGHELISESCIETQPIPFTLTETFDWVFFSSSEGVHHFASQYPLPSQVKIGVMGSGTLRALPSEWKAQFVGTSTDPSDVAAAFKSVVKENEKVLFPVAKSSLKSIGQPFPTHQTQHVVVYETTPVNKSIPPCALYVFSSPSNFNAFISHHSVPASSLIVSFGPSTTAAIRAKGFEVTVEMKQIEEKNIADTIMALIGSC
jgi:uroporphyrinogen-III synthase